jgi:hypothetical protein
MVSGTCPQFVTQCAQRSFASGRVSSLPCSYDLMCQSQTSGRLRFYTRWPVFAAWTIRCWSLGPSRRYLPRTFPWMLGPYPGSLSGAPTRFFPLSFGLPATVRRSAVWRNSVRRLQYGPLYRGCSHSLMFRPPSLLATRVVPTAGAFRNQGSCDFYFRAPCGSLPSRTSDMLAVRIGQLTAGDLHPIRFATLSAASNR